MLGPKTDHFRSEGSNLLIKLTRGRIGICPDRISCDIGINPSSVLSLATVTKSVKPQTMADCRLIDTYIHTYIHDSIPNTHRNGAV